MKILDTAKQRIAKLGKSKSAFTIAHAAASACDQSYGVSLLRVAVGLDCQNKKLVQDLLRITEQQDFSNAAQAEMLNWLSERGLLGSAPQAN